MSSQKYKMDMCHGPLFSKIVRYSVPLMLTYLLQLVFHATDLIVIGRFSSHESLAAIGTTGAIIGLQVNFFTGLSVGANVVAAQLYGAKENKLFSRTAHTTIALALIAGFIVMLTGCIFARWMLHMINVPADIFEKAWVYMIISFIGAPLLMVYNFGCAILRAMGDTRRPLYFLTIAGVVNVILNLIFVLVFKMDVEGVGLATMASKALSAYFVIMAMVRSHGVGRLIIRNIRINWDLAKKILRIGIPAGVQSACFAVSNMLIQSGVNYFGSVAVAGLTATTTLEAILYALNYGIHQTTVAFVGQNYGGKMFKRLRRCIWVGLVYACSTILFCGCLMTIFGRELLSIFNEDPQVQDWGMLRIKITFILYFLLGAMDQFNGALRGLGYSVFAALSSIFGACVFRVFWVKCVFFQMEKPSMSVLLWSYPVSWFLVALIDAMMLIYCYKKIFSGGSSPLKTVKV